MTEPHPDIPARGQTRRGFLGASTGVLAAPLILPSWTHRGAPNEQIRLGAIGCGRMGRGDIKGLLRAGLDADRNARFVAVCDVDRKRAELAKELLLGEYTKRLADGEKPPEITVYTDFRELLAQSDIDGVSISTPDFWHGYQAAAGAKAGKDMYVQKPITFTIREGQQLVKAVRDAEVVLQVGSQQRSHKAFHQGCELVRNGRIGALERIHVMLPEDKGTGDPRQSEVPAHLDYDLWMGPTATAPYAERRVHPDADFSRPGWLQIQRYTLGMITGWGSHMNDIAQWGHGGDHDSGIVSIEATGEFPQRGLFDVHTKFRAEAKYADGVELIQETGPAGVRFEGDDGWVYVKRWKVEAENPKLLEEETPEDGVHLYRSTNHYANFLDCMRSRKDPAAPIEVGHRSNSVCMVTHIAMKLGRRLEWDPTTEAFVGDDEANAMLDYEHRAPWVL